MKNVTELVRFDWFIKFMFRDKSDFDILEGFLSELLKEDILEKALVKTVIGFYNIGLPKEKIAEALNISVEIVTQIIENQ
ncbi:MAG: hypothetical protein U5L45_06695 [Saprospiraceae bacterium]|nr:hypothetical protein [Saprospiraceae bacterium]